MKYVEYSKEDREFINRLELNALEVTAFTDYTDGYIIENGMVTGFQMKF